MGEFTWLNKQGVASNFGFEVQMVDRSCIEYREDGHVISIEVEMGMNGATLCLLYSPGRFDKWDNAESINVDDQKRMEENFRRALDFQSVSAVVDAPNRTSRAFYAWFQS